MNYKSVVNVVGFILIFLGLSMIFSIGWSIYYSDDPTFNRDLGALFKAMIMTVVSGLVLVLGTYSKKKKSISIRDGFAIVALGWVFMAAFSALPFYFSTETSYVNAFFEAMSGITTTGASVLNNIESFFTIFFIFTSSVIKKEKTSAISSEAIDLEYSVRKPFV